MRYKDGRVESAEWRADQPLAPSDMSATEAAPPGAATEASPPSHP